MAYAKIYIQDRHINKERVLEHELGHALGWLHSSSSYHIMNSEWERGGFGSSGLSHIIYMERSEALRSTNISN